MVCRVRNWKERCILPLHIHFVGIKGTGMSALAQVTAQIEGAVVTGSDVSERFFTDAVLERAKIPVLNFSAHNVDKADLVVASAAYGENHEEIARARELNIPVYTYPSSLVDLCLKSGGLPFPEPMAKLQLLP